MNNPKYYDELTYFIIDSLLDKLGEGFNIAHTGTVNPRYYKGHMKMGEQGGLKIYISQKGHRCDPTMKEIEAYFRKYRD